MLLTITLAACGSSSSNTGSTGSSGDGSSGASQGSGDSGALLAEAKAAVAKAEQEPTVIGAASLGSFKPAPGGFFYYVSCDESIVGCKVIADAVQQGTEALGYKFESCNAGATAQGTSNCMKSALDAKPSVVLMGGIDAADSQGGYAALQRAGIPIVGVDTGNAPGTTAGEVGGYCAAQAKQIADALIADANGNAKVLMLASNFTACTRERDAAFKAEYQRLCPGCELDVVDFDVATMVQSLPGQIQAALVQHPGITGIYAVIDQATSIAVTAVQQAGKSNSIVATGFDANPANVQLIRQGKVQKYDESSAQGETGWASADMAARVYSKVKVPKVSVPNVYLIDPNTVGAITNSMNMWLGTPDYETQFKKLWGQG
ncbi:MAG: substrate-binding domain-containing protein [Nocardioides sp.]